MSSNILTSIFDPVKQASGAMGNVGGALGNIGGRYGHLGEQFANLGAYQVSFKPTDFFDASTHFDMSTYYDPANLVKQY